MKFPTYLEQENLLFDRMAVRDHRERSVNLDWERHRFLFEEVALRLSERLLDLTESFEAGLDLGCRGGAFGRHLIAMDKIKNLVSVDLCTGMLPDSSSALIADEEFLPFAPQSFDLVGSVLGLHWTNDLPGSLIQIAKTLRPNGLFLGAVFGIETLSELKVCLSEAELEICGGASPRVSPYTEVKDAGALLQRAGFALPVTDVDIITMKYSNPFALMAELRGMGEANALVERQKSFTNRKVLIRTAELYQEKFGDEEGRIPATFQIIYLTGWSPHDSQQKPSRRGSGKINLQDILE